MEARYFIAILLVALVLGCVQPEYKPTFVKTTPYPSITPTPETTKPTTEVTPIAKPVHTPTVEVKPTPTKSATTPTPTPTPTSTPTPFTFEFGKKYRAKVVRVIDGDTIDVRIDGKIYRIRLLGVDCPEIEADRNRPYEYDFDNGSRIFSRMGTKS